MANTFEVNGTYGRSKNPATIYVYENRNGSRWYCVEDSQNVNLTYEEIGECVDVEEVSDVDCFTWSKGINSQEELIEAVED